MARHSILLILAVVFSACATTPLPRIASAPPVARVPVILVPGITGSALTDANGEVVWGTGSRLLGPHDDGYGFARALDEPLEGSTRISASAVIEEMSLLGVVHKDVYGPVAQTLEKNGYRRDDPANLWLFAYDWRQDNVATAAKLVNQIASFGWPEIDLICQSNGAHICRYLAKYGATSLEAAERGLIVRPGFRVRKVILVGTSNGGSLRILRELHRGRRYVPLIGRKIRPEVLFTFPSLYQDLPIYRPTPFVDSDGQSLELDLFDPRTWVDKHLSIFAPEATKRADRRPDIFADGAARRNFLERSLDRAKRFHRLLQADVPGFVAPRFYQVQNAYDPTPEKVVVDRDGKLIFTGDPELKDQPYLRASISAPGDGHATVESQNFLSPAERATLATPTFNVDGDHFELILDHGSLRRLVELLAEGTKK